MYSRCRTSSVSGVQRGDDVHLLPGGVDQHVVSDHQGGQGVRLVLAALPGDRRLFEVGEVSSNSGGAGFEPLDQRRRPGRRTTAAATGILSVARW